MAEQLSDDAKKDRETQKNLLRKVINQLKTNKEGNENDSIFVADHLGGKLDNILDMFVAEAKKETREKGDKEEDRRDQKGILSRLKQLPSNLRDATQKVAEAPGKAAGGIGKLFGKMGGILGKGLIGGGVLLAGAGILAGGAGFLLQQLNDFDAEKVKTQVGILFSMTDGFKENMEFLGKSGVFLAAMTGIGLGLAVFGAGSAVAGMSDALLDRFNSDWASGVKNNVVTLLSIKDEVGGNLEFLASGGAFMVSMTTIAAGLALFGAGSGIAALLSYSDWAVNTKDNILTLLSINDAVAALDNSMLGESGKLFAALSAIGTGLAIFGIGQSVNALTLTTDWSERTKTNVLTLLTIGDEAGTGFLQKSKDVASGLAILGGGLSVFGVGNLVTGLTQAANGIIAFFTGGQSPIEQMLSLADKEEKINSAARGMDKLSQSLNTISDIKIGSGTIDIEGMLDDFGHVPALLDGLANGGEIEFETFGRNKKIDFRKGILDPSLKVPEISKTMMEVNSALGIGPMRNPEIIQQSAENASLQRDNVLTKETPAQITDASQQNNVNITQTHDVAATDDTDKVPA